MKNKLLLLYLLLCITELIAEYFQLQILRWCVKPMLMITLSIYFYGEAKSTYNSFAKKIQAALFFSWAGDVFLMFPGLFLPGLISFLIAHIFYIFSFYENINGPILKLNMIRTLLFVVSFLAFSVGLFSALYPYLDKMLIPVAVYTVFLTAMGVSAALRKDAVNNLSFKFVLSGAVFFMGSDSMIAINKFMWNDEFPYARIIIMSTYVLAQYLIVKGSLYYLVSTKPE